jgi:hypothetical protein
MGMGELKLKAKQFEQKTDEAVDKELKQTNLFSGTLVENDLTFECIREPADAPVAPGNAVRLVDLRDRIEVFKRMTSVGYVVPSQVQAMRNTLNLQDRKGQSVRGQVVDVSEITPTFTVLVTQ